MISSAVVVRSKWNNWCKALRHSRWSINMKSFPLFFLCLFLYQYSKSWSQSVLNTHAPWFHLFCSNFKIQPQFSSVTQLCPTLCDPMNCSTPGLPVHHQLPEFTQTHIHRGSDAIQPSHPLSSPSPPARNPSQHQSLFQWVNSSHDVAKVLELQL